MMLISLNSYLDFDFLADAAVLSKSFSVDAEAVVMVI